MKPYKLLVAYEVVEFLSNVSRKEERLIHSRFRQIRDFPANYSEFSELDNNGRRIETSILGKYAIQYWIDDADQHVKIINIQLADGDL